MLGKSGKIFLSLQPLHPQLVSADDNELAATLGTAQSFGACHRALKIADMQIEVVKAGLVHNFLIPAVMSRSMKPHYRSVTYKEGMELIPNLKRNKVQVNSIFQQERI